MGNVRPAALITKALRYYRFFGFRATVAKSIIVALDRLPWLPVPATLLCRISVGDQIIPAANSHNQAVIIVSHESSRTGAPILALNIISELGKSYPIVTILLGPGSLADEFRKRSALSIGPLIGRDHSFRLLDAHIRRIKRQYRIKYAIVCSIESCPALRPLAENSIPAILLMHEFAAYTRPYSKLSEAAHWVSGIVFSSALTRDNALEVEPSFRGRKIVILPQGQCEIPGATNGREPDASDEIEAVFHPPHWPEKPFVVLGCGSVEYRKGIDLFFSGAAQLLRERFPMGFRFVWIGAGFDPVHEVTYSAYLADQIERQGLTEHAKILGPVSRLDRAYERADVFFLSSRLDPLPNVTIDAMMKGIPVVCFDRATGIADILRQSPETSECVVPYLDVGRAAAVIRRLAVEPEFRAAVSAAARKLAMQTFDMKSYVSKLDELGHEANCVLPGKIPDYGGHGCDPTRPGDSGWDLSRAVLPGAGSGGISGDESVQGAPGTELAGARIRPQDAVPGGPRRD